MKRVVAVLLVSLLALHSADARLVPAWSHSKLLKRADLVIIATPVKSGDHKPGGPLAPIDKEDLAYLSPVVTECRVDSVLKGKHEGKTVALPHYRYDSKKGTQNGVSLVINGPCLVKFKLDPETGEGGKFLIYLVRLDDGTLSFVTGQFDPRFSVFSLEPMPAFGK